MDYEFRNMGGVYNIKQVGVHSPPPQTKSRARYHILITLQRYGYLSIQTNYLN